jgi:hypothetical protein
MTPREGEVPPCPDLYVVKVAGRGVVSKLALHCTLGYLISRSRLTKNFYRTQDSCIPYLIEVVYITFRETSHIQLFGLLDVDIMRQVRGRCCAVYHLA